jgi:hypothetical protein
MKGKAYTKGDLSQHAQPADDGSAMGCYGIGQGPGLLVLHGAMSYALIHLELAEWLAGALVYLLSRRGRGR